MDPITLLAAATAAFNGVKKAVEVGREISDIYSQLSSWAGHVGNLQDAIRGIEEEEKNPSIWKKITFEKSETAEAFDIYAAKQKLIEMEKEIRHMFLYGDLNHLGMDGYNEFRTMRQQVRDKRNKIFRDQKEAREKFIDDLKLYSILGVSVLVGILSLWFVIELLFKYA
jgi:hypothetical protein